MHFLLAPSHDEVLEIINALENKATGHASIAVKLLKLIPDLIIVPPCKLVNLSFISGSFPDPLKIVKVITIHKNEQLSPYFPAFDIWHDNGEDYA